MKNSLLFFAFILMVLSLGCSGKDSVRKDHYSHLTTKNEALYDTLITLSRDESWNLGSRYVLWVTKKGNVLIEGCAYNEGLSYREKSIDPEKIVELIQAFRTAGVLALPDRYSSSGCKTTFTDGTNVLFTIKLGSVRKEVEHYTGCIGFPYEEPFFHLERLIDSVANTKQWMDWSQR